MIIATTTTRMMTTSSTVTTTAIIVVGMVDRPAGNIWYSIIAYTIKRYIESTKVQI